MASSDWRNAIIDLTNDSDNDSNNNEVEFAFPPAIPIATLEPSSATPKSPRTSDPRPPFLGNGHTPHHAGAHTLSSLATSASTYKASGLDTSGRNGASSQSYVRGFGGNRSGAESTIAPTPGQSAKRRKLSVPETQTHHSKPAQSNGVPPNHQSATPNSQAAPAGPTTTTTPAAKVRTTDKVMSINEMKTALKTGAGSVPFLEEVLASAPRPLHIRRLSQDTQVAPKRPASSSLPASIPIQNEPPRSSLPFARLPSTNPPSTNLPLARSFIHDEMEVDTSLPLAVGDTDGAQGTVGETISNQSQKMKKDHRGNDPYVDIPKLLQETTITSAVPEKARGVPSIEKPPLPTLTSQSPRVGAIVKGGFTEEDDHYLIFLKEVKKYPWRDITTEFAKHRPPRQYHNLQSHYSAVLNKRNRSQDPATLNLPPHFSAEATIDWPAVHAGAPRPPSARLPRSSSPPNNSRNRRVPASLAEQDYSSGADSESRRERSRRAPAVNYNWMHLRTQFADNTEQGSVSGVVRDGSDELESNMHLDSPTEQAPIPYAEATSQIYPLGFQFEADDARVGLIANQESSGGSKEKLPYLNSAQRRSLQGFPSEYGWGHGIDREWNGAVLHVDFSPGEMDLVEKAITELLPTGSSQSRHGTRRRTLRHKLKQLTEPHRLQLVYQLSRRLSSRSTASIKAFLDDARVGRVPEDPQVQRLAAVRSKTFSSRRGESTASTIRQRELGLQSRRGWKTASNPLSYQTKNTTMDTMGSTWFWTGASSDIHTVSWSPNGECFAAGAVAVTDQDSMQYNRPNNLLYGNYLHEVIHELGEHNIRRPKTETGANSTDAMFESQDPRLYTTVSSVAFSPGGNLMYSAGYDHHVYIWIIGEGSSQPTLGRALLHKAEVDMMAVSQTHAGRVATAAKRNSDNSVKLITFDEGSLDDSFRPEIHNYTSKKAVNQPDLNILPTALKFEPTYGRLLLAGFGANVRQDNGLDTTGDLCIWDVETQTNLSVHGSSRNVFDVAFNPYQRNEPFFAIGCVANGNVNRGTRSVIRLYSGSHDPIRYSRQVELECEALDMNDVVWCPYDEHLIAAGCTNGRAYVWDIRQPHRPLRVLSHGPSLMPLQDGVPHEVTDTGVRFLSWGNNSTRLYSGSSDGVVKVWDVTRSHSDTHVKDLVVTDSGIMSGAFSPDFSKLILGEVNGSVNVLEVGGAGCDPEELRYVSWAPEKEEGDTALPSSIVASAATGSAAEMTDYLLESGQLQLVPMGGLPLRQAVQGPNYVGPYDSSVDAPYLRQQALDFQLEMATIPAPNCTISACKSSIDKTTSEETGDSGRSSDRIPDELRQQWKAPIATRTTTKTTTASIQGIIPGKSKCTECNRPARPCTSTSTVSILCERCSFACLRCGASNPVAAATTTLTCDSCAGVWEMGALGYECVQQPVARPVLPDVPLLRQFGKTAYMEFIEDAVETSFGDEVNALTDYYFSLALDRPESPPL